MSNEPSTTNSPLVSSAWLKSHLTHANLVLLDASNAANKSGLNPIDGEQHIPNAIQFNLAEKFSDLASPFPMTFPTVEQFEDVCSDLGINNSHTIVVYDNLGTYWSPRVWWMFKTMGHQNIFVLNGGLPDWIEHGFDTVTNYKVLSDQGTYSASFDSKKLNTFDFICSNIQTQQHVVIDARSNDRFLGITPEPREGLRSGNIPNSVNIPYTEVLENGKFKSNDELLRVFQNRNLDSRPLTFSCGSGVTACIVMLAAELVLTNETSIYDGSWTEYGTRMQHGESLQSHD